MKPILAALLAAAAGTLACACTAQGAAAQPRAAVTVTARSRAHSRSHVQAAAKPVASASVAATSADTHWGAGQARTRRAAVTRHPGPGPAGCLSRYLGTKAVPSGDSGDSVYVNIDFKNLDNRTCTLDGFPGVSLGGGKPVTQIGLPSLENLATKRRLVTLKPGGIAWTQLQIVLASTYPAAMCHPKAAGFLDIIPPNQTIAIPTSYQATACAKPVHLLTVDAVQLGMNP